MQPAKQAPRPKRPAPTPAARPKTVLVAEHPVVAVRKVEAREAVQARPELGLAVAHYATMCIPLLLAVLFGAGHDAMDRPDPDAAVARAQYTVVLVVGILGLAGMAYLATRSRPEAMFGVAAGIPIGIWMATLGRTFGGFYCNNPRLWTWGTTYPCDPDALIGAELFGVVALPLAGAGIAAAVLHRSNPKAAMALFLGAAMALAAAFTIAAALVLPNVGGDVAKAAAANKAVQHTPGLEAAVLVLALLGLAAWRLRRRPAA